MKRVVLFTLILAYSVSISVLSIAEDNKPVVVRLEAEEGSGNYVVVAAPDASNGKFIGIDHTLDDDENFNYSLVFENVPKATTIKMVYATPGIGDVVIYVEENGVNIARGSINFLSSGDWNPYGGDELEAMATGLNIQEGSVVTMIATGSVNIDYFEFIYNEEDVIKPVDSKQKEEVKSLNNVFISVLIWRDSSCHNQDASFSVQKDRNSQFLPLSIAENSYDKGLGMLTFRRLKLCRDRY